MKSEKLLNYENEIKRKKFHLLSFFIPLYYIVFPKSILIFISLLLIFIITIDIYRLYFKQNINLPIIRHINTTIRPYEKNSLMSATLLVIISFIIILTFKKEIAIISISIASICDTIAAIYGLKHGRTKLLFNKTLEGSFSFLITGCFLVFLLNYIMGLSLNIIYLIISLFAASIIEAITPTKYDNITVPLIAAVTMHYLI